MLKVGIVDDHQLFRKSLALLVDNFKDIKVVIEAENGKDFLEKLKKNEIDIVLMDIMMPQMNGYDTCKVLQKDFPDIKIMIVSQLNTKESIRKIVEVGGHGFFSKKSDPARLENAIHSLYKNGYHFSSELQTFLREVMVSQKSNILKSKTPSIKLSSKELIILKMATQELSSSEIADKLFINARTVDSHRKRIMQKTGSKNFTGAIIFALKHYYISLDE